MASVGILGGMYLKSKGNINLAPKSDQKTESQNVASDKIELTVSADVNGKVSGKTKANAEVFVNEKELKADANGNFSTNLVLDEGENFIVVSVNDEDGNTAEENLTVNYEQN